MFDNVQFDQRGHEAFYQVDSVEGVWNRGRRESPNLGYKPGSGLGYFPCPPTDSLVDLRTEMAQRMAECGIATSAHFHEVATGGQCEIDLVAKPLLESADQIMLARYIIRNVARRAGKTATFMPKPLFGDNGSGMHTHLSIWKDNHPLLAGHGYAGLSDLGLHAIGGLIKHAQALCAFANPTTNSYKRLVPGFEAPTKVSYSRRNRAAIIRVPVNSPSPQSRRIEYRCPDSAANPYLLFSAMLMAVLDGIQNKLRPGEPLDKDIYDLQPQELDTVPTTPTDARGLAGRSAGRPRILAPRRCLHSRRDRHMDLVQAEPRSRDHPGPAASLRVFALLRRISRTAFVREAFQPDVSMSQARKRDLYASDTYTTGLTSTGSASGRRGSIIGSQCVENQGDRARDQHVVGEIENSAIEVNGIDVKVDEIPHVAINQAIITVTEGTGHDQGQGNCQDGARRGAHEEKPVANEERGDDREPGKYLAAVRQARTESPESAGVLTRVQLEDVRHDRDRRGRGRSDSLEDDRLGRQVERRTAQRDRPEEHPAPQTDASFALHSLPSSFLAQRIQ